MADVKIHMYKEHNRNYTIKLVVICTKLNGYFKNLRTACLYLQFDSLAGKFNQVELNVPYVRCVDFSLTGLHH